MFVEARGFQYLSMQAPIQESLLMDYYSNEVKGAFGPKPLYAWYIMNEIRISARPDIVHIITLQRPY